MMSANQFSVKQIEQLKLAVAQGFDLAATQKYINEELEIPLSYMETRFLIADLNLELFDKNLALKQEEEESKKTEEQMQEAMRVEAADTVAQGGVQVTQDSIQRPGAVANGKVIFSDGEHSSWYITPEGQLGLDSQTPGYQPSSEDIAEFQESLKTLLS